MKLYKIETTDPRGKKNIMYILYDKETAQRSLSFGKLADLNDSFYSTIARDDTRFYEKVMSHPDVKEIALADVPLGFIGTPLLVDFLREQIPEEFL